MGSPNISIFVNFRWSFALAGLFARRGDDLRKTYKNNRFFIGFSHIRSCAQASKIDKKSLRIGISSESPHWSFSERSFFELASVKMVPDSSPERLERPLGTLLDALGAPLGRSWAPLGRSWVPLGRSQASHFSIFVKHIKQKLKK